MARITTARSREPTAVPMLYPVGSILGAVPPWPCQGHRDRPRLSQRCAALHRRRNTAGESVESPDLVRWFEAPDEDGRIVLVRRPGEHGLAAYKRLTLDREPQLLGDAMSLRTTWAGEPNCFRDARLNR